MERGKIVFAAFFLSFTLFAMLSLQLVAALTLQKAYVTKPTSGNVTVIDLSTNTVTKIININDPTGVTINDVEVVGNKAYVTIQHSGGGGFLDNKTKFRVIRIPVAVKVSPIRVSIEPRNTLASIGN